METITAPASFLTAMGNLALDVRLLVLQMMPFLLIILFAWGYISFLFGATQKLDLKKIVFIPLALFTLVRFYPTVIDVTGNAYGIVIRAFDKKEYKKLYTEILGVTEELSAYNDIAQRELDKQKIILNNDKKSDNFVGNLFKTQEQINANREANKKINEELAAIESLSGNIIEKAAFKIWDFFSLPTIRIIRFIIDRVRDVFLSLLVIFGCLAVFFECIPAFKGILNKWFKWYTAVTFWALTVCILDGMFLAFVQASVDMAEGFLKNAKEVGTIEKIILTDAPGVLGSQHFEIKATDFGEKWYTYGGTEGINKAMQVIMVLCYCMVPYITSLYIGGEQAGMFMSKVVSVGSMATRQILSTSTNVTSTVSRGAGSVMGGSAGAAVGGAVGNVAGLATGAAAVNSSGNA